MSDSYAVLVIQNGSKFAKGFRFCVVKGPVIDGPIDPANVVECYRTEGEARRKADESPGRIH